MDMVGEPQLDAYTPEPQVSIALEVLLRNGMWVKRRFQFPRDTFETCLMNGQRSDYGMEMTHRCALRASIYGELACMVPTLLHGENMCWFHTLNKDHNPTRACLFDGAKLELKLAAAAVPEFGICFPRTSFAHEREMLDAPENGGLDTEPTGDWQGWKKRAPSDSDRLRVNRKGREVLYFVQPPPTTMDITFSDLRAEVCHTLRLEDSRRVSFQAGPFVCAADFREDGLGLYGTYFGSDIVINERHMKTVRGAALIDVIEVHVPNGSV